MSRVPPLQYEAMNERQREIYERIVGKRGGVRGPFNAWLYNAELADKVEAFGRYVRYEISLPLSLRELAVVLIARHWDSQYMWYAHSRIARQEGISDAILSAIAERRPVTYESAEQKAVADFTTSLLETHQVGDAAFKAIEDRWGKVGAVELTAFIGNFSMVGLALNAFKVELPDGEKPQLPV